MFLFLYPHLVIFDQSSFMIFKKKKSWFYDFKKRFNRVQSSVTIHVFGPNVEPGLHLLRQSDLLPPPRWDDSTGRRFPLSRRKTSERRIDAERRDAVCKKGKTKSNSFGFCCKIVLEVLVFPKNMGTGPWCYKKLHGGPTFLTFIAFSLTSFWKNFLGVLF